MWTSSSCCRISPVTWTSSSAPVKMCRLALLMTLVSVNLFVSSQAAPKLPGCRLEHKAKGPEVFIPIQGSDVSCGTEVLFPIPQGEVKNVIDVRNCQNYFKCTGNSCLHCPCGDGETFNPVTSQCDTSNAPCECEQTTTILPPTTEGVMPLPASQTTTTEAILIVNGGGADAGQPSGSNPNTNTQPPVSSDVIIIAAIVSATVIVIVVIVMGVFCWQRRQAPPASRVSKSASPKLSSRNANPTHDGYSASVPSTEKHVYAEIDERTVNHGNKHWQHGGSLRAPPLPDHQPPPPAATSPSFTATCPHHHNRTDSGICSSDNSFSTNYHRRTFQPIHLPHHIPIGVPYNERQAGAQCCAEDLYDGREDSSVSTDSQYSQSSHPTSLDSHDVDMNTPLHCHHSKTNYMSKQVYI